MIGAVKNLLAPSLAGILAGANKVVADLEAHANLSTIKAEALLEDSARILTQSNVHAAEARQAERVAAKLKELVS